jgi:hypothetical protein
MIDFSNPYLRSSVFIGGCPSFRIAKERESTRKFSDRIYRIDKILELTGRHGPKALDNLTPSPRRAQSFNPTDFLCELRVLCVK